MCMYIMHILFVYLWICQLKELIEIYKDVINDDIHDPHKQKVVFFIFSPFSSAETVSAIKIKYTNNFKINKYFLETPQIIWVLLKLYNK